MIWKDLLLMKFENGFRILNNKDTEDKFFVIDDVRLKIGETMVTLIKLVDRVRMLDNDMIRLNSKLSIVLEHRGMDKEVAQNQTKNEKFNTTGEEDDIKENPKPNSFGVTPNTK